MTEGVSLAAMTETPVVLVVAQRPGPATGLPTRTEQSDLEFVLHAGHGEFPRAIFAPGSIKACFELMCRAFTLAEASQGPVFLLADQIPVGVIFESTGPSYESRFPVCGKGPLGSHPVDLDALKRIMMTHA